MNTQHHYGIEQARARLPLIAAEAQAGYSSLITKHGKAVAVVVPLAQWQQMQAQLAAPQNLLALRGSGRSVWPHDAAQEVAHLRAEWA